MRITRTKLQRLQACANERGIIAALAVDQRGALRKEFAQFRSEVATDAELALFKQKVSHILSGQASALLVDPEYGLDALRQRATTVGALLSYEKTGYDATKPGRLPDLLPQWSARRLLEAGSDAVKILFYYNPFDDPRINEIKQAFIERVGAECAALDAPFFLEPLAYDDRYAAHGYDFACLKPRYVQAIMEEFSKDRYQVDILKVEIPINSAYLAGSKAWQGGESAYDRQAALDHFRATAAAARKPFLYLSGGVSDEVFRESLELAREAAVPYCGVLCGRATWKGGVRAFVEKGTAGLESWLREQGMRNIQALNATVNQGAQPWYSLYGGLDQIEVIA
ncbi:MAG TPA: tagatose 1,6-diphosphate aldolase [Ktedonobacteraceae bacterium]|nr:tagatose 1,6-diphosphate aldolase [Ktedonobacteraceae bacterium]